MIMVFIVLVAAQSPELVKISGDRDLAGFLASVQHQNLASYETGSMSFSVLVVEAGRAREFEGDVIWSDTKTYWNHRNRQGLVPSVEVGPKLGPWVDRESIETPSEAATFQPSGAQGLLLISRGGKSEHPRELHVRPDQVWFRHDAEGRTWADHFDPSVFPDDEYTYVLRREADDQVILDRTSSDGSRARIVFSLPDGGNVVSYDFRPESQGFPSRGTYEWAVHSSGVRYLRRYEFQRENYLGEDFGAKTYRLVIGDFDPAPQIVPSRFELRSFPLKPGVIIDEQTGTGRKRYTYGARGATGDSRPVEERLQLDFLASQLQKSGFAAKGR